MLRTTIARSLAITALVVSGLLAGSPPLQAATVPDGVGLAAVAPVTVTATSTGWSHTISGMAAHLCGWSTPALWSAIARTNGIADPDRIGLGQRIVVRCSVNQPSVISPPALPQQQQAKSRWVAPLTGTLWVRGDCKVGGSGGHWLAQRRGHLHRGIDLSRSYNVPIRSIHAGVVFFVGYERGGAGWYLKIAHGRIDGKSIYSTYMHLVREPLLARGARVEAGQTVGYVGSTGGSSGPHLHFQIHRGGAYNVNTVNPSQFLRAHGIEVKGC